MDRNTFLKNLKTARKNARYSQAEVGKRIGVVQTTIGQWENGKRDPGVSNLIKLGELYGVDFIASPEQKDSVKPNESGVTAMDKQAKEILLKQMTLLQEECKENGSGYESPRDLAAMSSAIADLANAYAKLLDL